MNYRVVFLSLIMFIFCCGSSAQKPQQTITPPIKIDMSDNMPVAHASLPLQPVSSEPCPADMVHVEGEYCANLEEVCLKWLDKPLCLKHDAKKQCVEYSTPMRCAEFKKPTICKGKTQHMNFCINKYEAQNKFGEKPELQVSWYQAKEKCEVLGKRLCIDNEWTQACRGPNNNPYPYGYVRDDTACRIDLPWQDPTTHTFEQLDKSLPSGTMSRCVSDYGMFDSTGNCDEWTVSSGNSPYISVLKGGHPHGVRNRCTPKTEGHGPTFVFYDTSYRCCKDIK